MFFVHEKFIYAETQVDAVKVFDARNTGVPELVDQIETVYSLMVMKVKNV
jgi:hypothetical protein